jgi:hypothetical protein
MYKKGGNQKKGANFGTFLKILYIKKTRLYKIGTRLYIIGFLKNVRNRSVTANIGWYVVLEKRHHFWELLEPCPKGTYVTYPYLGSHCDSVLVVIRYT